MRDWSLKLAESGEVSKMISLTLWSLSARGYVKGRVPFQRVFAPSHVRLTKKKRSRYRKVNEPKDRLPRVIAHGAN
jgi:hypothetical protein